MKSSFFTVDLVKEVLQEDPRMRARLNEEDYKAIVDICQKVKLPDMGGQIIVEATVDHILNSCEYYLNEKLS